ncbi:protein O-mannosyl-transferase 1-like [Littorina saxatilis]|uniref:dolichyl-phosphate-mannose--protein mannosyltransferase n=1 Tax=Littorina saxatilis TaxID=31220 RepID=A0AAN9G4B3_9CAEN
MAAVTTSSTTTQPRQRHTPLSASRQREQGDGASVAGMGFEPQEDRAMRSSGEGEGEEGRRREASRPFSIQLEVDVMQLLLTVASLLSRTWHLGLPRAVVFDELHFAKFVSLYMKRIFFFDVHPPLGKMLLALAGSYAGFEGEVKFDRIGAEFPSTVPVEALRLVPAVLGALVVPLVYQIAVELGLARWAALLAASFVLFDNALLVQSRFMLMEGMLIFFSCLAIMSYLKFRNLRHRAFSVRWWFWVCLTGVSFTCSLSIKYSGAFTALLIVCLAAKDFWALLDDLRLTDMCLVKQLLARVLMLVCVPVGVYLAVFYLHLTLLTKAGPHDNVMTSAFQASLEGGLAALTKGQPLNVAYGSQITLRHTANVAGSPCWLHSHSHVYPMRYPDGRGSSHQQQVTCYVFKDVNNWWIVKHPDRETLVVDESPVYVHHGDVVQLVHGITSRALNSHDVAAPTTPQNQEVSCYIDYNVSMATQNLWRVEIVNRQSEKDAWQTIQSQVRLVHVKTSTALRITGKQLPEWGFHQLEVAADRLINQRDTVWNVEEHRYTKKKGKEGESTAEVRDEDLLPLEPTRLSFWSKLWELQVRMLMSRQDTELEHKFSSTPTEWPFMVRNIAYWMSPASNCQIHLLGNLVVWAASSLSVLVYLALVVFHYLRRCRACYDITEEEWQHFVFVGELLVGGYLLHYVPYFSVDRTLFLHHYLPAVVFKVLVLAALLDHVAAQNWRYIPMSTVVSYGTVVLISAAVYTFLEFLPVSLGNVDLNVEEMKKLTWRESWDFLLHSKV